MRAARLLLAGALAAISLPAYARSNLVVNPGFEERDEVGNLAAWDSWGSDVGRLVEGEVFEWEMEGRSGRRSISIREEGWGRRGWWYTIMRGVKSGRWYCVSLWAKRDRPTGWLPEVHAFGQRRVINLYSVDAWQKFDWLLNSGEFRGDAVLKLVNWRKPYKVWFDDIAVEELEVTINNRVESGELRWSCPANGALIFFEVEASRSERFESPAGIGKTMNNEIPVPSDLAPGEWYWRVKALHNETVLALSRPVKIEVQKGEEQTSPSPPPPREVLPSLCPESSEHMSFDEDLNLIVDGKPFFPIGVFSLPPEKFSEAKRAGFNSAVTNDVQAARRAGVRAIVYRGFHFAARNKRTPDTLPRREVIRWVIARYLWDEPAQTNASPEKVFRAHTNEKEADPHHPTAIVVYRPENFWSYASASDILMTDPYPVPHRPLSVVSESVKAARRAVRDRKPVWAIIQAFNWMEASQEARRTGWARWPTYAEERCMAYLAVINGARGILFYRYAGEGKHDPANWRALKRVAGELKRMSPILLSRTLSLPVSLVVQGPHESARKGEAKRIEYTLRSDGRRIYLIAANNWPGRRRVTFSFERGLRAVVNVPFEKRTIKTQPRSFSDLFEPYDVHVYTLRFK